MKNSGRDRNRSTDRKGDYKKSGNRASEGRGRIHVDKPYDKKNDDGSNDEKRNRRSDDRRSDDKKSYGSGRSYKPESGERKRYGSKSRDGREGGERRFSEKNKYEENTPRKNYSTRGRNERGSDEGSERTLRERTGTGDRKFKREERPFKAGTKPAGRRAREVGEKRPRTTTESQRDYIKKERSFDQQERPYKAGTRPSGRERNESDERSGGERPFNSGRSGEERSFDRRASGRDRGGRYGDKRNYRDKNTGRAPKKDDGKIRLNKYIANSGICSRREADEYIAAGVVSVNGQIITEMGYKVNPGDEVKFHDKPIRSEKMVYVLLNKPKDFLTTTNDDRDRKTVMNLVKDAGRERIYPVGRLDRATTGVLLLTNDGDLTKKLTHPSHEIKKIYQVELDKSLKPSDLEKIKDGIELEDGVAEVDEIIYSGDSKKVLGIELHSGKNRIVRRIFEALDYRVVKLDRVYFAGLTKKDLQRGRWRFLTEMEVNMLKMLTAKKPKRVVN